MFREIWNSYCDRYVNWLLGNTSKPKTNPPEYIHEYVWRGVGSKAHRIGVIVAARKDNKALIGWSKVNTKAGDVFDRHAGIVEALKKINELDTAKKFPPRFKRQLTAFETRCTRYFKGCDVLKITG